MNETPEEKNKRREKDPSTAKKVKDILLVNKPKIVFPSTSQVDYRAIKEGMINYKESKYVDDFEDVDFIVQ